MSATGTTPPFIYLTVSALDMLSDEPSVRQFNKANPEVRRAVAALTQAVRKAGVRVRDSQDKPVVREDHLKLFSAEEIWMCDLAIDVIAMLATGGGMSTDLGPTILDKLKQLDRDGHVGGHHWKSEVRRAGAGPAEFGDLRARVPRRRLHG